AHRLIRQRLERRLHDAAIVLEFGRGRDHNYRMLELREPLRRVGRWIPLAGPDHHDVLGPVAAWVIERLSGHVDEQGRPAEHRIGVIDRSGPGLSTDMVQWRQKRLLEDAEDQRADQVVAQAAQWAARGRQSRAERGRVTGSQGDRVGTEDGPGTTPGL